MVAGGMPLTAYVGHALLFPLLARFTEWSVGVAAAVAGGYLVVVVVAATPWRRWRGSGPVEGLMRRASGPRRSGRSQRRRRSGRRPDGRRGGYRAESRPCGEVGKAAKVERSGGPGGGG